MKLFSRNHRQYAWILVACIVLCLVLMELTGNNQSFQGTTWYQILLQTIAPVIVIFCGIWNKRTILDGAMSWKQGFREGAMISLLFGIISPFVFWAYYELVNMAILDHHVRALYQLPSTMPSSTVIIIDMVVQLCSAIIFGLIISAISAAILRRSKRARK